MFVLPPVPPPLAPAFAPRLDDSFDRFFGSAVAPAPRAPRRSTSPRPTPPTPSARRARRRQGRLKVSVEGRRVSVETPSRRTSAETASRRRSASLYRERAAARYARSFSLPAEVDQAASQAKLDNGVLTLTLAKKRAGRRDASIDDQLSRPVRPPPSGQRGRTSNA